MSSPPNKRINLTNHGLDGSLAAEARPAVVCRLRARRWADEECGDGESSSTSYSHRLAEGLVGVRIGRCDGSRW